MKPSFSATLSLDFLAEIARNISLPILSQKIISTDYSEFRSVSNSFSESICYLNDRSNYLGDLSEINGLVILDSNFLQELDQLNETTSYVCIENPKYFFAAIYKEIANSEITNELSSYETRLHQYVDKSAHIARSARIGSDVAIGRNCIISEGVCIHDGTKIGDNVFVKDNAVIGGTGFGFAVRKGHPPIRIPHFGGVTIMDDVEIGSGTTIDRGTFANTLLSSHVKVDNGVHIGHNVKIGERTILTAHVEISGSVNIGSDCWIAPSVAIREKITIGNNVLVGIGSVVIHDIDENSVVAGVPARLIREQN
jgi:UDP-3-O-[3-hydroxymyristoyl] glucosamine N-acyltransferase LpxD